MSSYLNVYAIKEKMNLCLFYFSTTEARELYPILKCTCDEKYKESDYKLPLTSELLDCIIDYYDNNITTISENKENLLRKIDKLNAILPKVENVKIYKQMQNDIAESEFFVIENDSEIKKFKECKWLFENASLIISDNKDWELWYSLN